MDKIILDRIAGNKLTVTEQQILDDWLDSSAKNKRIFLQLKMAFTKEDQQSLDKWKQDLWRTIEPVANKKRRDKSRSYLRWAASISIIIIGLGWVAFQLLSNQQEEITQRSEINYVEKASLRGQKLIVTLPDGSKVKLNSGSKIIAPESFGEERRVRIEGEGFFDVTKSEKPFIVIADEIEVMVLGTSFNVNSYSLDEISVAVKTGKVSVTAKSNDFYINKSLVPGERVIYTRGVPVLKTSDFNEEEVLGWKDNLLVFNDDIFSDVVKDLNNWYDVTFIIDEGIDFKENFNGKFINPTLKDVMESLAHLYAFNFQIHDKQVKITKQN